MSAFDPLRTFAARPLSLRPKGSVKPDARLGADFSPLGQLW
jgi:hypothetical protein